MGHTMGMVLTLLRKAFIKDYQNIDDAEVRAKHGVLCSALGIILNAILVLLKLFAAIVLAMNNGYVLSLALLGDTINNAFDIGSSVASLIGFRLSRKPADKGHPYGHARAEYVAGVVIGTAILFSAGTLLVESIRSIANNASLSYDLFAYLALGATIPIKGLQAYLNFAMGSLLRSPTLKGVGRDALTDMILSSLLLIGAILSTTFHWPFLDGYLGSFVALFLIYAGVRALIEGASPLLGEPMEKSFEEEIRAYIAKESDILGVHDIVCHQYGESVRFLTLHIEVDPSLTLLQAHETADRIEAGLSKQFHASVMVHVDPYDDHAELREKARALLQNIDPRLTCHDLHVEDQILHLDVLLPFDLDQKQEQIKRELSSLGYEVQVVFDHPYSD